MSDSDLQSLLADNHAGVLVTLKADGRPQLSNVNHTYDRDQQLLRVSITADRAKSKNLPGIRGRAITSPARTSGSGRWPTVTPN